jgi:hypothetical protein
MRTIAVILDRRFELDGFDPSQVFALTFSEAKFNNLVSRGGSLSTPIKLAKTANNTRLLGFPDETRETSLKPYTRYECEVRVDDQPIFYGFAVLEQSEQFYEMRIYGALADFFQTIGDKSIRDLDLSAQNHDWTAVNVFAATNASSNYCYPAINYGRWTGTKAARAHTDFFPAVYFKLLLEKAATEEGWALNNYAENWGIPFSLQDYMNEKGCLFDVELASDFTGAFVSLGVLGANFDTVNNDPTDHAFDYSSIGTAYGYELRPDGAYDFRATVDYDVALTSGQSFSACIVLVDGSGNVTKRLTDYETITNYTGTGTLQVNAWGVPYEANRYATIGYLTAGSPSFNVTISAGTKFECTKGEEAYKDGDKINLADTLPNIKIKDLYLFEAVRKNALIIANNQTKTLEFVTIDSIAAKWPIAKDWSDKVDYTAKPKREYRIGDFGQQNFVRWKDGTDDDPAYRANNELGNYTLLINDGGLPLEKEMYTAPFAATVEAVSFTDNIHARVLRYSGSGVAYDAPDIQPEPRAMPLVSDTANLVQITSGGGTVTDQIMGFPEDWTEIAAANWTAFEAMLDRMKLVSYMVNLTAIDIQELDVTIPVRVGNSYFMIREVEQWPANKVGLTKVKLMRL